MPVLALTAAVSAQQYNSASISGGFAYPSYSFSPLQHLSGIAPFFQSSGYDVDPSVPAGCSVEKATYLSRHSNIYANDNDYEIYIEPLIEKLNVTNATFTGELAFLRNWTNPISEDDIEQVTPSGDVDALALGVTFAARYPQFSNASANTTKIWAATSERSNQTAYSFAQGFARSLRMVPRLVEIYEGKNESADTLTPHSSCPAYSGSAGVKQSNVFLYQYAPSIITRLSQYTNVNLTAYDISAMQRLCGYETVIRNSSNFCGLFTANEWLQFEYANDIQYHYSLGYGSPVSPYLGMPWLNASTALLTDNNTAAQDFYISFTHREEPVFMTTVLGLFNNSAFTGTNDPNATFPLTEINYGRRFVSSAIIPFLGHIGLERMDCRARNTTSSYVRAIVNSAVQPIPGCSGGIGASCPLGEFVSLVGQKQAQYGDFVGACGLTSLSNATDTLNIYNQ
ncbi:putative Histidine acid phosphatase [Taphrina deformans PYCC 5710]|uniref:Histidine acid phosphatase n=1 Tax=Taphrina deformans (strain PYCC 5710 / ATCC 11124 / CBS 356.35 / IMI 108563 / JCM 9778 / NBRC 8474) TaxID=1097556 RepID=R4XH51_TAPDE|nr:putative Histidine acid phosphatase [Taphrina deformans PYCC 5710]|eukprot:CCG82711.1 putative Histidine acid phosphatase [Taphrina deformans PYCC 5710]